MHVKFSKSLYVCYVIAVFYETSSYTRNHVPSVVVEIKHTKLVFFLSSNMCQN